MRLLLRPSCSVRHSGLHLLRRRNLMTSPGRAIEHDVPDPASPQRPEKAHINPHASLRLHRKHESIENELSEAMRSSLMPITSSSARSPTSTTSSHDRIDNPFLYGTASTLTRPVNLALAPNRRRSSGRLQLHRQRSLSVGSLNDLGDGDPFAWLRQTVQEQRKQASQSEHVFLPSTSMPASPMAVSQFAASPASLHDDAPERTNDYFGAGLLSLVAGKGPVREHMQVESASFASSSTGSRFNFPSLPSLPSIPSFQAPSMPTFKAPPLPTFKAPPASTFMPDALARMMGGNVGENENKKYMDEDDQAASDEPDWARIKVRTSTFQYTGNIR